MCVEPDGSLIDMAEVRREVQAQLLFGARIVLRPRHAQIVSA